MRAWEKGRCSLITKWTAIWQVQATLPTPTPTPPHPKNAAKLTAITIEHPRPPTPPTHTHHTPPWLGPGGSNVLVQVTHAISWERPQLPELVPIDDEGSYLLTEDEADRVVPSRSAVLAAGRCGVRVCVAEWVGLRVCVVLMVVGWGGWVGAGEGSYLLTKDEADRVVPSRSAVLAAGRWARGGGVQESAECWVFWRTADSKMAHFTSKLSI